MVSLEVARGQAAAAAGVAVPDVWWQRSSGAAALQPLWWGVRRAACSALKTVGGDEAGAQGLDCGLHGGGHGELQRQVSEPTFLALAVGVVGSR
jgi:hypothetical protein